MQRVEITGSNIKRIDAETVAPVEVITRQDIERSGQPTIADVLRNLPANSGNSYGESFSNSFAPGAAGISLRGLGQKTTLVLINSRRVSGYGFAQNLQDSFVDLNSIPSSAVERVEILKDGASAIYGSDAIAGVVNIIMRRDFRGFEGTISGGQASGKNDYGATLTGGFGDLGSQKFNVFGVLDLYKRKEILLSDTEFGKDRDYRGTSGGRNLNSLTAGGTWRQLTNTGGLSNNFQAISSCPEGAITGLEAADMGLTNNANFATATNTFCPQHTNTLLSAIPGTERVGFLGRGTYEISPTMSAFVELGLSRNKTDQTFTNPFFNTTGLEPTSAGLKPFTYTINFAPGVAGNPFQTASNGGTAAGGATARYTGSLNDLGSRDSHITSDTGRLLAGLLYSYANWDFDSAVGYSKNKVESTGTNRLSKSGISAAFGVPSTPQPPVPVATSSTYQLDDFNLNSDAVRDSIRIENTRKATSSLRFIDTKATTELPAKFALPGGNIGLALGAEWRKESLKDKPSEATVNGDVLGQGSTATDGSRTSEAIYGELRLPLLKNLEMQLAARYDHYSDYGSSAVPKIGIKYTPTDTLALRGNVGKGFRAPTLPEISPSSATFFVQVNDPQSGTAQQISGVFAGNPNLKAEKSVSANLGVVFEPTRNFSTSLDYYWIKWKDIVIAADFQGLVDASCPNPPNGDPNLPNCPSTATVVRDPVTNNVVTVFNQYQNASALFTSGLDLEMRYQMPTATAGKFTARFNGIYVIKYEQDGVGYEGNNGYGSAFPRIKYTTALDWDYGAFSLTGRLNYTMGVEQQRLPGSYFAPTPAAFPNFQTGVYPAKTPDYYTLDLYGSYQITKNFKIAGSVANLLDKKPPYDPGIDSTNNYDFSQYDVRGRLVRVSLTYKM
ncbi:MAG: TonB-dependent receptor [Burkholderiales bacterium]|nr:TonB-dependent receptor [Burkholderiales bacterium]